MFKKLSVLLVALAFIIAPVMVSANDATTTSDSVEAISTSCIPYPGRPVGAPSVPTPPGGWCTPPAPTYPFVPTCIPYAPGTAVRLPSDVPGTPGSAWCYHTVIELPTEGPTQGATEAPTQAPTEGPTQEPTEGATEGPTQGVTEGPTTVEPTEGPTEDPCPTEPEECPTEPTEDPCPTEPEATPAPSSSTPAPSTPGGSNLLPQTSAAINMALAGASASFVTAGSALVFKNKRK